MTTKKPRVRFCWYCGRQLYGNHHAEVEIDGYHRILHKSCGKLYQQRFDIPFKVEWLNNVTVATITHWE